MYFLKMAMVPTALWQYWSVVATANCEDNVIRGGLPSCRSLKQVCCVSCARRNPPVRSEELENVVFQGKHSDAMRMLLLIVLASSTSLWLYLLPRKVAALTVTMVLLGWGLSSMLRAYCDAHRFMFAKVRSARFERCSAHHTPVVPFITVYWMVMYVAFLGTGHFSEFAGIHWPSAFIGFNDSKPLWRSMLLVGINTFAPQAMLAVVVVCVLLKVNMSELSALPSAGASTSGSVHRCSRMFGASLHLGKLCCSVQLQHHARSEVIGTEHRYQQMESSTLECNGVDESYHRVVCGCVAKHCLGLPHSIRQFLEGRSAQTVSSQEELKLHRTMQMSLHHMASCFVTFMLMIVLLFGCVSVLVHRRHLMIWALFAPKWVFDVCMCISGGAALILTFWVLQCNVFSWH